jgi:hypothetical protein
VRDDSLRTSERRHAHPAVGFNLPQQRGFSELPPAVIKQSSVIVLEPLLGSNGAEGAQCKAESTTTLRPPFESFLEDDHYTSILGVPLALMDY